MTNTRGRRYPGPTQQRVAVSSLRRGQHVVKVGAATASGPNGRPVEARFVRRARGSSPRHVVLHFDDGRALEVLRTATCTVLPA